MTPGSSAVTCLVRCFVAWYNHTIVLPFARTARVFHRGNPAPETSDRRFLGLASRDPLNAVFPNGQKPVAGDPSVRQAVPVNSKVWAYTGCVMTPA